ncbi:MAG TPA: O-antigen ligase family protein [Chitinophagales bacterium]|nr:O-antigen ligase family protein [Chitinophagales bacterium]
MTRKIFSKKIYLIGLALLAAALPFSMFLMSVSQFILAAGWLLSGNYGEKFIRFWNNKPALLLSSFYVLHLTGIAFTSDLPSGLADLRVKLPLLILPFILSGMPAVSGKNFSFLLLAFVASVLVNTIAVSINHEWLFISPIRFSMMVCFSFFILMYLIIEKVFNRWVRLTAVISASWLAIFIFNWQYETGIVTFAGALFFSLYYFAARMKKSWLKFSLIAMMIVLPVVSFLFVYSTMKKFFGDTAVQPLPSSEVTENGERYRHYPERRDIENGNYTWRYIAWEELNEAWSRRSGLALNGNDKNGNPLSATLIRFLTSKGYRKDASGVNRLTDGEVRAVENSIANVRYMDGKNLEDRLYETIWSIYNYRIGNNPQGNSVMQRFEFWRAGWNAFLEKIAIGHGTGSVKASLEKQYEIIKTPLDVKHRLKTHNQYLSTAVALGATGVVWLLAALLVPLFYERGYANYLFVTFLIIVMLAMLVEDTLETQAGATFIAFFYSLLSSGKIIHEDSSNLQ